jgi:hypothetical protein
MKYILLLSLSLLCSCSNITSDWRYNYNDYDDAALYDDYQFRIKSRSVYFERKDKLRKYGYSLRRSTFFLELKFPF